MTYYLKNTSGSIVNITDLGISLPNDASLVIDSNSINAYLTTDLQAAITAGNLILSTTDVGDNGGDMSIDEAISALTITSRFDTDNPHNVKLSQSITAEGVSFDVNDIIELTDGSETDLHIHDDRYYTETELGTSNTGTVAVHWDNITNTPAFGSLAWQTPALGNLVGMGATGSEPTGVDNGSYYLNTDDDHLYKLITGVWTDQGAPTEGDRVVFKDGVGSDDKIYEWDGSSWVSDPLPEDNWAIVISDDGDGNAAQYVYDSSGVPPDWIKIADVDWGDHQALSGRTDANSHPATAISFNNSGTDLSSTDVQTAILEIATEQGVDLDNIVFVAKNGVDVNTAVTLGTIANPYLTIQAAIDSISDASSTKKYVVYVMPGNYEENVVLNKNWVYITSPDRQATKLTSSSGNTLSIGGTTLSCTGVSNMTITSSSSTTTDNAILITGNNPRIFAIDVQALSGSRTLYVTGAYEQTIRHSWFNGGTVRIDAGVVNMHDSKVIEALTNVTAGTLRIHNVEFSHNGGDAIEQTGGTIIIVSAQLSSGSGSLDFNQGGGTVGWGWVEYDQEKVDFQGTKYLLFDSGDLYYDITGDTNITEKNIGDVISQIDSIITNILNSTSTHEGDTNNPHSVTFTQAVTADPDTDITAAEAENLTDGSDADSLHGHKATHNYYPHNNTTNVESALDYLYNNTGVEFTDTIFVAKNGSDADKPTTTNDISDNWGDGSMDHPYVTVQRGIAEAAALGTYAVVFVYPGTYVEDLVLAPNVCIYAFGKEPTRIGTNSGTHTLTFPTSGRVFYRGVNFRLNAFNIIHTPGAGGSISVWFEDCAVGGITMNGLGWNDYLQLRGSMFIYEKLTVHSAQFSWFNGESQITLGSGDVQIEIDDDGVEVAGPGGVAGGMVLRDIEVANKILIQGAIETWLYNTGIYNTITVDGADAVINIDNSSTPTDRNDIILLNGATMNLLDDAYAVGYDDTITQLGADNVQDAIQAVASQIVEFEMPSGTSFPTSPTPDAGDIFYRTDLNMTYQYDGSRNKWLSITQMFLDWGANVADGKYLNIHGATATQTGYLMPYNGTVISITAKIASGNQSKGVEIRRNNDRVTPLDTFTLSSGTYSSTVTNINFEAGDYLQAFVPSAGTPAKDIVVMAVVCWRE